MPIKGLFGPTIDLLAQNIDLRARNHNQISANVANVETPNFSPTRLDFEGELKNALHAKKPTTAGRTNERHIPLRGQSDSIDKVRGKVIEVPATAVGRDGNRVDIEAEMGKMAENQIMYNASVQMIAKKFDGLRQAIRGTGN